MPGMNLKFLENPAQRLATGRSMPLKKLEAVIVYGAPVQRAKVVKKVLPQTYILSLDKSTHYILLSILKHCDNLVKVEMLYHVRRKLLDLARSKTGNVFLQELIEKLPAVQKREIAEAFVMNVDEGELADLCRHEYGNHVAQKLLEFPASAEVIEERLIACLDGIVSDGYGQRVAAKYVSSVAGGAARAVQSLFPNYESENEELLGNRVEALLDSSSESYVLCALLKSIDVPPAVKDAIVATLAGACDDLVLGKRLAKGSGGAAKAGGDRFADEDDNEDALPDFAKKPAAAAAADGDAASAAPQPPRHIHTLVAALEHGDATQREMLVDALLPHSALLLRTKGLVDVAVTVFKFGTPEAQATLLRTFFDEDPAQAGGASAKKKGKTPSKEKAVAAATTTSATALAMDPVQTLFFRAVADCVDSMARIPKAAVADLLANMATLATSPVGSPVVQRLLATCGAATSTAVLATLQASLETLACDPCGNFLLQALLDHLPEVKREELGSTIVAGFVPDLLTKLASTQGSRLLQKAMAFASNAQIQALVTTFVEQSLEHEDDEVEERELAPEVDAQGRRLTPRQVQAYNRGRHYAIRRMTVVDFALHHTACFAVQGMLRECRSRQLIDERRLLMAELKKNVYELAVSPWAGRIVLDTMLTIATKELSEAIRNVVFLKVEGWLTEAPATMQQKGSADPTMRKAVQRRDRSGDSGAEGSDAKKQRTEKPQAAPAVDGDKQPKKQTKRFRTMKK